MSEKDLLISRIVEREDSPDDWARLDEFARQDGHVVGELLDTMRDESSLRLAVAETVAVADTVDLRRVELPFLTRHAWLPQWSGWMAAAVIVLFWIATSPHTEPNRGGRITSTIDQVEDVRDGELAKTQRARTEFGSDTVLRELPNLMVETRPIPGTGKTQVIYVRRTLERAIVSDAFTAAHDESGRPIRVQADLARWAPRTNY